MFHDNSMPVDRPQLSGCVASGRTAGTQGGRMPATRSKPSHAAKALIPLLVPLDRLALLSRTPRLGDVAAVVRICQHFGQRKPIVARRTGGTTVEPRGVVLAGNHQLLAAGELDWPLPRQEQRASRLVAPAQ